MEQNMLHCFNSGATTASIRIMICAWICFDRCLVVSPQEQIIVYYDMKHFIPHNVIHLCKSYNICRQYKNSKTRHAADSLAKHLLNKEDKEFWKEVK